MRDVDKPDLAVIQKWMQAVIFHPDGVAAGIESPDATNVIPLSAGGVEQLICRSASQSSVERLSVYSNAYRARLLEVLVGDYPALVKAIGEEAFVGLANGYLEAHPPTSYTLAELGRSFPDYLARTRPPHDDESGLPDWADFLIDLARLERIYSEVFDGAGIEGKGTLQVSELESMGPDLWQQARLVIAPCLRLASFRFPVHEFATAVRQQKEAVAPAANPTQLAITRRDYVVRRVPLTEVEFQVLSMLVAGASVGESIAAALSMTAGSIDDLAAEINRWFREWSAAGFFMGLADR